jgi:DNA-binding transcriptional LysR family regulator
MGQIEDLRLFALVVENRSISKAAEKLHIAKSAVSRRLNLLEERFGAHLIDRKPGVWEVTSTGLELYQRAVRVVNDVNEIDSDFTDAAHNLAGPLVISVPRDFGEAFLSPALLGFAKRHPDIQLTVDFDDRIVDLARENYDFAIRISHNIDTGVVAQKIGTSLHHLCASPEYLNTNPAPKDLEELQDHSLLNFGSARRAEWSFATSKGKETLLEFHPSLNSNNGTFLLNAAEQGFGVARLPDFVCSKSINAGRLLPILTDLPVQEWGIYIIHAEDRRLNRRMRLFTEEIKAACLKIPLCSKLG